MGGSARGRLTAGSLGAAGPADGGMLAGIPPTPELLARVAALPPANDEPPVDQGFSRAADLHFTLRRLLRPFAGALLAGPMLDGLDAVRSIALPCLMRAGI